MLEARVLKRRSSASVNSLRRKLSRAMTPIARSPTRIGTPSQLSVSPPKTIAPSSTPCSAVSSRSGRFVSRTRDVRTAAPSSNAGIFTRTFASTLYGNVTKFVAGSYSPIHNEFAPKTVRMRSPTTSTIASKSSCLASDAPISLTTASSALRCRVS